MITTKKRASRLVKYVVDMTITLPVTIGVKVSEDEDDPQFEALVLAQEKIDALLKDFKRQVAVGDDDYEVGSVHAV